MKGKYIVFGDAGFPQAVAFSETIVHSDMARAMGARNVLGAGFFAVVNDRFECYGESISLRIMSRPDQDSDILNEHFCGVTL